MFGTVEVHAGDFVKGKDGQFVGGHFILKVPRKFKREKIPIADVEEADIATEETVKRLGWGVAGGLLFGPVGLLAGLLLGGKKIVTFTCKLKDGRKFLGTTDSKTWTAIMAARLEAGPRELPRVTAAGKYGLDAGWKPTMDDPRNLPLDPGVRPGSVMRPKRSDEAGQVFGVIVVAGLFVVLGVLVIAWLAG